MRTIKCKMCGREFETESKGAPLYCSQNCRHEAQKENGRRFYAAKKAKQEKTKSEAKLPRRRTSHSNAQRRRELYVKGIKDEARAWLDKYNACGEQGAADMIAQEAGMTYSQWQALPIGVRVQKRYEIVHKKKYCLGRDSGVV